MRTSLLFRIYLVAFATCRVVGQAAEPASRMVELILREPLDREWAPEWVSLPFETAPGLMYPDQLGLIDENNEAPEHDFQVLTRHAHGQGRLDPPDQRKLRAGYPIDFTQKWSGKLQPFYAWWPFYGLWWGAYRPDGDYVAIFMTDPPRWLNPKPNLAKVQTGPEQIECEFSYRKGTRRWGILAAKTAQALPTSKAGATLVMRAMIRQAQNPLERVKDMVIPWPGMDEIGYPHLLCRPADIPAIREKARTHPLFRRVLEQYPDKPDDPAGLYLATGDEAAARAAINDLMKELRRWTDEVLDGDNYTEGIHDIGYTRPMRR